MEPEDFITFIKFLKKTAIFPYPGAAYFITRPAFFLLSISSVVKLSSQIRLRVPGDIFLAGFRKKICKHFFVAEASQFKSGLGRHLSWFYITRN
jgi:hypothetical protein